MTNFYRIQTCAGGQKLNLVREESQLGKDAPFKRTFDIKRYLDGLELVSEHKNVKIYLPPLLPQEYIARNLHVKIASGVEIPDVWTFGGANAVVSEKFKKVIESIENDLHQFQACKIFDQHGTQITTSNFYLFHVRRIVKVEGFAQDIRRLSNLRVPIQEREYFTAIHKSIDVKDTLKSLDIWGVHRSYFAFHISDKVYEFFREKDITGLKPYRKPSGEAGEGLVKYG